MPIAVGGIRTASKNDRKREARDSEGGGMGNARRPLIGGLLALSFLGVGCSSAPPAGPDPRALLARELSFLKVGGTSREEVLLALGLPTAQFQGDEILAYRLMRSTTEEGNSRLEVVSREVDAGDPRLAYWNRAEFSLILVFDGAHVLRRHSLVKVR